MKKNFFRRRSISYRGRGNFATQLSFSQPIVKLAVWLYFIICILVIGTRVFFMTQADHYRDEITALVSEAAGVDVHAGEFSAGFERFWPVITVRQLELARPGGPVSLTLPEVKARLAWSSLWHLEPRFQLLRISSPDLRITRLDKTTLDIASFVVNLPEGSDEESNFAASGDSRVAAWLLAQKKLELVNGTITYDDRYSPGAAEVRVMNANVVFEQTLLDWRVAVDGTAHISAEESPHKQGECFTAVARIDRHIFTDTSNPLTWKGQAYVRFSHADVAKLLSRAGFPQFMSSGSGAVSSSFPVSPPFSAPLSLPPSPVCSPLPSFSPLPGVSPVPTESSAAVPLPSASSEGLFAQAPIARIEKVNANAMATVVKDFFMIFLRKIDCILIVTIFYAKIN